MLEFTEFNNFDDFFAWYMNVIKSKVDGFNVSMSSKEIHLKIGKLTKEQFELTNRVIRRIQKMPKNIILVNDNKAGTFYSYWDNYRKKAVIAYPSVTYHWLRYPDLVKGAIQHEIGHIINGDILYKPKDKEYQKAHAGCINMSMDCRINQNINYQILDYINRALFTFENKQTDLIVPETWMVKKAGLPIALKNKVTWIYIHDNYHKIHPDPLPEDIVEAQLDVGTYVMTTVDKYGEPKGTYGIVTEVKLDVGKQDYMVGKISQEEIDALKNEDYTFFEELQAKGDILYPQMGIYEFNRLTKELKPLQKPVVSRAVPPKVGDIALALRKINSIKEATFAMVINQVSEKEYTLWEFSDELQKIIGKGDAVGYYTKLNTASNPSELFTSNQEKGIFLEDFILRNLTPPMPSGNKIQKEKQIERPNIGDVVVINKGAEKGKYGVIIAEDASGNYKINEVSEEIAKAMVGKL